MKIILHFYFPFKVFPENERERERERERARAIAISSPRRSRSRRQTFQSPLIAISPSRDRTRSRSQSMARSHEDRDLAVDRDLAFMRSHWIEITIDGAISRRSRSRLRKIAPSIAILQRRRDCDRAVDGRRTMFSVVVDDFFLGCGLCFSGFVFSFFFSKHQKIFSRKFFEMQPNTMETFSFSGN